MSNQPKRLKDGKTVLPSTAHLDSFEFDTPETFSEPDRVDCDVFLIELAKTGVPSTAARALGRGEACFQKLRSTNSSFAAAWDWAIRESALALETEARRRAVEGVEKPVWYKGDCVGYETVYSDALLALLLKTNHPNFRTAAEEEQAAGTGQVTQVTITTVPRGRFLPKEEVDDEAYTDDDYHMPTHDNDGSSRSDQPSEAPDEVD